MYFDSTKISKIDGNKGVLLYRGYSISDLVKNSTYEEICFLLIFGKLPTDKEFKEFNDSLIKRRNISQDTLNFIYNYKNININDLLKIIINLFKSFEPQENNEIEIGLSLISKLPLILAHYKHAKTSNKMLSINSSVSLTQNFLSMLHDSELAEAELKILEQVMIVQAEHGANASSFVARVATGAEASIYSAITAAICTFEGGLHGGALEKVIEMLDEIAQPSNATMYINDKIKRGLPIYGYGHRVYRTQDPRAKTMRGLAHKISILNLDTRYFDILEAINEAMEPQTKYGINVNVDFYTAIIYHFLKIPKYMYVATFIMSRIVGWVAQIVEQKSNNILIRPRLNYVGRDECYYANKYLD